MGAISKLAGQVAAGGDPGLERRGADLAAAARRRRPRPRPATERSSLTILVVVVTINAVNFIDGLDGLAAGIVAIAALSFFVYSYTLTRTGSALPRRPCPRWRPPCWPGCASGSCRTTSTRPGSSWATPASMLLGLLLAYAPISSMDSLDPAR